MTDQLQIALEAILDMPCFKGSMPRDLARDIANHVLSALKPSADGWQDISTAPKDCNILVVGIGADRRPLHAIVHWMCKEHCFLSSRRCDAENPSPECKFEWIGDLFDNGTRYGIEFTHWMSLPYPPQQKDLRDE